MTEVECCDTVEVHEDLLKIVQDTMPDEQELNDLADLFKIFGDYTRIRILFVLFESEVCVCDLAQALNMTQSAISHQLKILKQSRLVKSRREGKSIFYSLADEHVETCVLLSRKIVNDKNVEYMHVDYEPKDAEYLRGIKGSATYAEIKKWIKEQYNVSVSSLYIAQCKDACGFEKRENYNTGAEGHRVPNCPEEKKKLILEAFKHFKMI